MSRLQMQLTYEIHNPFPKIPLLPLQRSDNIIIIKILQSFRGGTELYRLGPFDDALIPAMEDGRSWTEAHVNVAGAHLTIAMLQVGPNLMLELFQYDQPADRSAIPPRNCDLGGHHLAFKVADLDAAKSYLADHGCRVMAGPIVLDEGPCAGLRVNYFLDPWGNQLELVEYAHQAFMDSSPVKTYSSS